MRLYTLGLLFLICLSCHAQTPQSPYPGKVIEAYNIEYQSYYGIYFLEEEALLTKEMVRKMTEEYFSHVQWVDSLSDPAEVAEITYEYYANPMKDFTPPDEEYLNYTGIGLSKAEMKALQDPKGAILLSFAGPYKQARKDQLHILKLMDALAVNRDVIITDYVTYESFNPRSFRLSQMSGYTAGDQDITSQISIHLYRQEAFCRAITLGMRKFALPDFSIEDLPCSNQYSYASLINLVCQTVFEQGVIGEEGEIYLDMERLENQSLKIEMLRELEEGAEKRAVIQVAQVDPQEGDDYNTQLRLVFESPQASSAQQAQNEVLSRLFGKKNTLNYIEHDDEILALSKKAQAELPRLQKMFQEGLAFGYSLLLKAPFRINEEEGYEWMWLEVTNWEDNKIKGVLQNDPYHVPNLEAGSPVEALQEDIFDYILYKPDGSYEGNETGKLIQKKRE